MVASKRSAICWHDVRGLRRSAHHVPALTCGKKRRAQGKTIDFALHLQPPSGSPNLANIQRDVNDHPVKPRLKPFERGTKAFSERLSHVGWCRVAMYLGEPTRLDIRMYNLTNSL